MSRQIFKDLSKKYWEGFPATVQWDVNLKKKFFFFGFYFFN